MEMNGLFVTTNIQTGSRDGSFLNDGVDAFIASAEWLIRNNYTCPKKLATRGSNHSGLVAASCLSLRADLFGACVPTIGTDDLIRFFDSLQQGEGQSIPLMIRLDVLDENSKSPLIQVVADRFAFLVGALDMQV
jgi:hypothetical protein